MFYSDRMIEIITLIVCALPFVNMVYYGVKRCVPNAYITDAIKTFTYGHTVTAAVLVLLGVLI